MIAVPVPTPHKLPVELTVAMVASLLLHVPPLTELANGMHAPTHTAVPPVIVPGLLVTVTDFVT